MVLVYLLRCDGLLYIESYIISYIEDCFAGIVVNITALRTVPHHTQTYVGYVDLKPQNPHLYTYMHSGWGAVGYVNSQPTHRST